MHIEKRFATIKKMPIFAVLETKFWYNGNGVVAQMVEQRTENPCVGGSIPPNTTKNLLKISGLVKLHTILRIKK